MKSLPKPTTDQQRRFVEYISEAHSWCEDLSLFGTPFICFLAPEPRYNTEDYRKAYGHLDYHIGSTNFYFRGPDPKRFEFAEDVIERFSFLMFPYLDNTACFKYHRFLLSLPHVQQFLSLNRRGLSSRTIKRVLNLLYVGNDLLRLEYEKHNGYQVQRLRKRYTAIHTDLQNRELAKIEQAVRRLEEL